MVNNQVWLPDWVNKYVPTYLSTYFWRELAKWNKCIVTTGTYDKGVLQICLDQAEQIFNLKGAPKRC